jgi:diguanylate cyclase (GGDEF)-like protein
MRQHRPRDAVSLRRNTAPGEGAPASKQPNSVSASGESLTVRRLEALLEVTSVVRGEKDLTSALATIVETVAEALEFQTVVLNLYRAQFDDFCVTNVHGNAAAKEALLGCTYEWSSWQALLVERYRHGGAYLIPHGSFDWSEDVGSRYVPKVEASDDPEAWHPDDELFVPLEDSEGRMLAIFSVGEPRTGRRPSAEELDVLVALAGHAAIAIETAQQTESMARHRAGLEQLLEVSSTLTAAQSTDAILRTVCRGIQTALGFQKVSIELVEPETGLLRSRAAAGWEADDPSVLRPLPFDPVRELFDSAFEISGCYLLPNDEARKRIDEIHVKYSSTNNGRGPHAWNHHWLLVPLYDRDGEAFGLIWADEPDDRLLPSAERLQALRVFANQATTALLAAEQFERMRFLADHDPLTNLLNRRSFVSHLEAEVARSRRYNHPLALLVFDLNELKTLNDTYGHAAGDEALQYVAATLTAGLRGGDHAFRIGGDEFAVLLAEANAVDAQAAAERIARSLVDSPARWDWKLTTSFGIAVCDDDECESGALMRIADDAMYAMKHSRGDAEDGDLDAVA